MEIKGSRDNPNIKDTAIGDKTKMRKLVISSSSESEGYIQPLIKRLKNHPDFSPLIFHPVPKGNRWAAFTIIYKRAEIFFDNNPIIDAVFIPSDRVEHLPVAISAFHKNIPIVQLYGGDISSGTFDDFNRYIYSIYASVVFCSTEEAAKRVRLLYTLLNKDTKHVYVSGMTHFDDVEINESDVLDSEYDLVLYNPITRDKNPEERMGKELEEIQNLLDKHTLWAEPNEDLGRDYVIKFAKNLIDNNVTYLARIDRSKFLGLLKNCSRLIGNSSMVCYEAKKFLNGGQIIRIGERNKLREEVPITTGGSDKIVKILEGIDFDKI